MGKRNKVVKLTRRKINYIIRNKINNNSTKMIAADMKVSISTVKRVWMYYLKNREAVPIKKSGRKKKELDDETRIQIIKIHKEQKLGARRLEKILEYKYCKHIPHNAIHEVLLEEGLAGENKKKKKRRKPWIRYERKHSLTAVHLDWHTSKVNGKEVCIVLDDSSRCILAGGEFDAATAQTSINLIQDVLTRFGDIRKIEQVITDHGSQFFANKKDSKGNSESSFEAFLKESGIRHIVARIKHPQTNGKVEKWYDLYEKQRDKFESFDIFVNWYNSVRYHESLDTKHYLQTPDDAFLSRLPQACKLNLFLKLMEPELYELL
jgi:putative transposase